MKTRYFSTLLALAAVVSCQTNKELDGSCPVCVSVQSTKTELSGNDVLWSSGDRISLSNSNNTHCILTLTGGAGTTQGSFAGTLKNAAPATDTYYAFNQFANNTVVLDNVNGYKTKFPQKQYSNAFAPVMVGKAEGQSASNVSISLKNVGSYLKFALVGNSTLSLATIKLTMKETCAGDFYLADGDYSNPVPVFTGNVKNILYYDADSTTITTDTSFFYVQVPNLTYSQGITVLISATDGTSTVSKTIGGSGITIERDRIYTLPAITFEKPLEYEWSKGYLTVDENGYRFTDTDSPTGTETQGRFFQFNSSMAIEANLLGSTYNKDSIKVWYYDTATSSYKSGYITTTKGENPVSAWSQIPANDADDPCSRVQVSPGQNKWMTPSEAQWRTWAVYKTLTDPYKGTVKRDGVNGAIYTVSDTHEAYIFETRYLTTGGEATQGSGWCMMWIDNGVVVQSGNKLPFIQIKPAANNSNTPAYKTTTVNVVLAEDNSTIHTQALQMRCVRIKK